MKIDETDRRIINHLLLCGRASCREMAKKAGVSVVTVMNRLKRLEEEKIIRNYTVNLDLEKIGYRLSILTMLRVSKGKLSEVEKHLKHCTNVSLILDVTGHYDAIILGRFKTRRELDSFLKKIQAYDFIERTETMLILNEMKEGILSI